MALIFFYIFLYIFFTYNQILPVSAVPPGRGSISLEQPGQFNLC